jgi:succinyl-CoA synthetase alpha subunit
MMLDSIERLAMDPETHVLVLLSKPPAPEVAQRVLDAARVSGKRVVVNFLGERELLREGNGVRVPTLEAAAAWAVAFARDEAEATEIVLAPQLLGEAARIAERFADTQARVEGLYSGGTLAKEAALVLEWSGIAHEVLDLGDDEFTVGRPHPMIDMRLRTERILSTSEDPRVAVLLLDVVLGYGSHADPASELGPAIERTRARAAQAGRTLAVVASICGTERDPQGFDRQAAELSAAGVLLAPSNAQAARLATAMIRAPRVADARA